MGAAATVAIGMKMARGMPDAIVSNRMKSERVGMYRYYMDLDYPDDISVYMADDEAHERPIPIEYINRTAKAEHHELYYFPDRSAAADEGYGWRKSYVDTSYDPIPHSVQTNTLELCAVVAMSQGMADHRAYPMTVAPIANGEMDYAAIPMMQIRT